MNARIEIRDIPLNTPPRFLEENGQLILDLPDGFTFALSKAATEGNEVNDIKREGTSSFSLPITDKNLWILRKWCFPNNHSKDFTRIRIHVFDGPHILAEDRLDVLQINYQDDTIEIGLFESPENGVADGANSLLLNTVDFGTFELTAANLETHWANAVWEDGVTDDFYFAMVHYGNFIIDQYEVSVEDFRPLLSVPGTLMRGFCALGWVFDSPLLETEWFRRLWWYGLGKEYYRHSDWGRLVRLDVETSADIAAAGPFQILTFDIENEDLGGNHSISTYSIYEQTQPLAGMLRYRILGQIENPGGSDVDFNLVLSFIGGGELESWPFTVAAGDTLDIDHTWEGEYGQGDQFTISLGAMTGALNVLAGFRFTALPTEKYYYRGDIIDIRDSIGPKYTFLQFLQGLLHMGFRFETNFGTRTVTMYATEQADIFAEGVIEGYYRPAYDARDLSEIIQHRSAVLDFPKEDTPEALIIGFAKSTDKYIETLALPEDVPMYSKRLEFATGTKDVLEYSENPFFEPTGNYQWFGEAAPKINTPAMWDNEDRARSFEIGPRILVAHGLAAQQRLIGGTVTDSQWSFEGALRSTMPYVAQVPGDFDQLGGVAVAALTYIVYDDPDYAAYSLWAMWLKKDNRFYKNLPTIEVLALLASRDYHTFSFRDRIEVKLLGRPTILKAIAVKDFQTESPLLTPITLQIDPDECA